MALGKSIKMYLTIFIATTCIYMVLYQYHISHQPMPSPDIMKNKDISAELSPGSGGKVASSSSLVKRYNLFLWSPMSYLTSTRQQEEQKPIHTPSSSSSSDSIAVAVSSMPSLLSPLASPSPQPSISSSQLANTSVSVHKSLDKHKIAISSDQVGSLTLHTTHNTSTTTTTTTTSTTSGSTSIIKLANSTKITATPATRTKPRTTFQTQITTAAAKAAAETFAPAKEPPPLYIITPTYRRPEQLAELTRLGYTLKHVVNLLWLVIEDANKTSPLVTQTLNRIGVPYLYFLAPMPEQYKKTKKAKPRGVSNRNRGLEYLRENATEGVFYFADDDNTYDISIFEQMRYTKKVSMWPVGLVTKLGVSSPILRKGKIDGFYDGWIGGRKFPVDMAGFAVSVKFLHSRPKAKMPFKPGYEEDGFLRSLAPFNQTEIEFLASNCTEILTWHTQTKKNAPAEALNMTKYRDTNVVNLDKVLVRP